MSEATERPLPWRVSKGREAVGAEFRPVYKLIDAAHRVVAVTWDADAAERIVHAANGEAEVEADTIALERDIALSRIAELERAVNTHEEAIGLLREAEALFGPLRADAPDSVSRLSDRIRALLSRLDAGGTSNAE